MLCYAAATAARLKTQVYDCVGFYCIPVQELRDVTTVEKPCKRILGKVSRTYVYTRKSLKINQSFCRMFLAKSLKLQSLYLQLQCCVLQFKKYSLYVFVLYLYLCSFDNV